MGYSQREVMQMTPRKYFRLFREWLDINTTGKHIEKRGKLDVDGLP